MARIQSIVSFENRLDNLFDASKNLPDEELIRSHWARYLCILSYGYVETSVRSLLLEYTKKRSNQEVTNFVEKKLDQFRNATFKNIKEIVGLFNQDWEEKLENDIDQEIKDAIYSLANNRHQIAHGKNTGTTLAYVKEWFKKSKKFISYLENLFDGKLVSITN